MRLTVGAVRNKQGWTEIVRIKKEFGFAMSNLKSQICYLKSVFILTISVHPCLNLLSVEDGRRLVPALTAFVVL
jgi:hypothetical protein